MKLHVVVALVLLSACCLVNGQLGLAGAGGAGMNPLAMYLMMGLMGDPNMKHMPLMSVLMRNPTAMMNPMGVFIMSNILGVDINKIATPVALANGMGSTLDMMRWLPLMMGDPNTMSLMFSLGAGGGMGQGMGGGMGMGMGGGMGMY